MSSIKKEKMLIFNNNYIIFYLKNVFLGLTSLLGGIFEGRKELEMEIK